MRLSRNKNENFIIGIFCLIFFLSFSVTSEADEVDFTDVTELDWYYDDLQPLVRDNIINGYPDRTFRSRVSLTTDSFIKMLVRTRDASIQNGEDYWASTYILYAKEYDWFNGVSVSTTASLNRYDTCKIIVNYLGDSVVYPDDLTSYADYLSDYNSIPFNYKMDVLKAFYLGIITGYPDNTFKGDNILNRGEASTIIHRILDDDYRIPPLSLASVINLNELFSDIYYVLNNESLDSEVYFVDNRLQLDYEDDLITVNETGIAKNYVSETENILENLLVFDFNESSKYDHYYVVDYNGSTLSYSYYDEYDDKLLYRFYISIRDESVNLMINPWIMTMREYDGFYDSLTSEILKVISPSHYEELSNFVRLTMKELINNPNAVINQTIPFTDQTCVLHKERLEMATFNFSR